MPEASEKVNVTDDARSAALAEANVGLRQKIAHQERVEAALRASEAQMRLLLNSTGEAIYSVDLHGNCTFCNRACLQLLGYDDEHDLLGHNMHALMHHTRSDGTPYPVEECRIYQAFREGKGTHLEDEVLWRKDGTSLPAEYWSYPIRQDDELLGSVVTFVDISERKQALEALRVSEERFRKIFEHTNDAIFVINPGKDEIIDFNPKACELLGFTREELLARRVSDIHPADMARMNAFAESVFEKGQGWTDELTCRTKSGDVLAAEISASVIEMDGQDYMLSLVRDLTERKREEAALEAAKEAAEAANRAKSGFLAKMSHELRTPLNGILGYAQLLKRDDALTETQRAGLDVIEGSGMHLLTLINDILDLSKIEAGKLEVQPTAFHLAEFLRSVTDFARMRAEQKGLSFTFDVRAPLPDVVRGDERRLRQILLNLLSNAIKFTRSGGVTLSVDVRDTAAGNARLRFEVEDTGPGIAPEQHGDVFRPFEQIRGADDHTEGTGLGLAISRRLATMMGGTLDLESTPGQGSTFRLEVDLPILETAATPPEVRQRHITGMVGRVRKVLVVDDKSINRSLLIGLLAPLGFEIEEAADGREAVEKAEASRPDIILMDLVMPVLDGFEATRRLRQSPTLKTVPVIALSASAFAYTQKESLESGCDAFLAKPIQLDVLLEKLQTLLGLEWTYSDPEPSETFAAAVLPESMEQSNASEGPTEGEAAALYESAMQGDIRSLLAELETSERLRDPDHPFGARLRALAQNYRMEQIRDLIRPYLEDRA